MKRMVLLSLLALAGCNPAQVASVQVEAAKVGGELQAACAVALPLAGAAVVIPTVGPFIATGVQVGCGTASGLAKLAADPSSAAWVNQQIGLLRAAVHG